MTNFLLAVAVLSSVFCVVFFLRAKRCEVKYHKLTSEVLALQKQLNSTLVDSLRVKSHLEQITKQNNMNADFLSRYRKEAETLQRKVQSCPVCCTID